MLDKIKDNSILIVPSSMKSSLLKDISSSKDLLDIKNCVSGEEMALSFAKYLLLSRSVLY